jgi:vitamin B12 transporter
VGATYFKTDIKNLIVSTPTFTSVENRSEANIYGVEAFFQATPYDSVTFRADYTFVRAEDGSNGQDLLRRPKHKAGASLNYAFSAKGAVGISATYVGRRRDIDAVTFARIVTDDFTTVDFHASYDLTPTVQIIGRLSNLLDEEIEDPDGFSQPGRAIFAGLRATF